METRRHNRRGTDGGSDVNLDTHGMKLPVLMTNVIPKPRAVRREDLLGRWEVVDQLADR